jgi:hypothetical protein
MDKILNTETDSDVKLRHEYNNMISENFTIETKSDLLLRTLKTYFTEERFKHVLPIITGSSKISLRVIDWFVTNYSKKNQIIYKITENNEECYINIHNHYKSQLNAYGKKYIDPFCRGKDRILFKVSDAQCVMSNLSQINFFKWALQYKVLDYIDTNYNIIVKDMTDTINNTPSSNKRRIFSNNTGKTFKKYEDGITVDIPLQNMDMNINK